MATVRYGSACCSAEETPASSTANAAKTTTNPTVIPTVNRSARATARPRDTWASSPATASVT